MRFRVENLHKAFNGAAVLKGIDLEIASGETFVLLGGSGSGKSVFLRHLVRLLIPDEGRVFWDDVEITRKSEHEMAALRPRVGIVFQSGGLLGSLTVHQNVALGLTETRRLPEKQVREIVEEKLSLVDLEDFGHLLPAELSGGMKKRAALARTLAMEPDAILLDEPTAELDPPMADNVDRLVLDMKERVGKTFVIVTHDLLHAQRVADRVALLNEGRLAFDGTMREIYESRDPIIREFVASRTRGKDAGAASGDGDAPGENRSTPGPTPAPDPA